MSEIQGRLRHPGAGEGCGEGEGGFWLIVRSRGYVVLGRDGHLYEADFTKFDCRCFGNPYENGWDVDALWLGRVYPPPCSDYSEGGCRVHS